MQSPHEQRAQLLMQQQRYDQAEQELRLELSNNPDNATAHALLAMCLSERKQFDAATEEAHASIGLAPDDPFMHYAHAHVLEDQDKHKDARAAILHAISFAPHSSEFFALLSSIEIQMRHWNEALDAANKGLQFDPEHTGCNNCRAIALTRLGRRDEAGATIGAALERDPANSNTHANMGWKLLHDSNPREAAVHFREALRIDPQNEWARAGIVEALKAKNVIYRLLLRYFLWMSSLPSGVQWALIIGLLFGINLLANIGAQNPAIQPLIGVIIIAYGAFVVMSWAGYPFFNLLLRLDSFGRHALSKEQRLAANWLGISLILIAILMGATLWQLGIDGLLDAAAWGLLILPVCAIFVCKGNAQLGMAAGTLMVAGFGVASYTMTFIMNEPEKGAQFFDYFLWGCVLSTWIAPALARR